MLARVFGTQSTFVRCFSALPHTSQQFSGGESLQIPELDGLTLIRASDRMWNAVVTLPASQIDCSQGAPPRVAVLRDAFALHTAAERPLSQTLLRVGSGHFAVDACLSKPHRRIVVDEYHRTESGDYKLHLVAKNLLRYLSDSGLRLSIVPQLGRSNSTDKVYSSVRQSTNEVLMVAPTAFGFNAQAAQDNHFMHAAAEAGTGTDLTSKVCSEFSGLHHQLTEVHGVRVNLMQHNLQHQTPDACFPNNWFSTHALGEAAGGCTERSMVLYPMKCPNRAAERRPEIIDVLEAKGYTNIVDLSTAEKGDKHFEGTGVLVIDRVNGVAYVALSNRADKTIAEEWVAKLGYKELVTFDSVDARNMPVYHTNVMMAIGTGVAIVCGESIRDDKQRQHLFATLGKTHEIVDISTAQMDSLCGNALELEDGRGLPVMAMSTQAYTAFTPDQRKMILRHCADIAHAPVDTLEEVGGGGVRCTLAELF